jgi:hypothetical protein
MSVLTSAHDTSYVHPADKLARLRGDGARPGKARGPLLWVVAYVDQRGGSPLADQAFADIDASLEAGADAVCLINEWCSLAELEDTLAQVRRRYPRAPLGVNYLGDEQGKGGARNPDPKDPYGYVDSFRLARDFALQLVWTDFSGVDLIEEKPPLDLQAVEAERGRGGDFFYCSGVHMKYSTLKDPSKPVERSALQAMGWVDGVILTGSKTGVPADPGRVKRVREAIGNYPLGLASGVSPRNAHEVRDLIDFCLVASSLQGENKRIEAAKVRALRQELG